MPTCSAIKCHYKHINKKNGKSIHLFPFSRPEILKKWVLNVRRKNWFPTKRSVLCSDHFEEHCFIKTGSYISLKKDAVPTLFHLPTHLRKTMWLKGPEQDTSIAHNLHIKREVIDLPTEETPQDSSSNILSSKYKPLSSTTNTETRSLTGAPHIVKCNIISNESLSESLTGSPNEVNFEETSTKESSSQFVKIKSYGSLRCESIPVTNVEPQATLHKTPNLQRMLDIANQTIREYRRKLKIKQQNVRRLNKRINSMQAEINLLKKKNFLTEHTTDLLKENFSGLPLDIILRKLKNKKVPYSSSLQSFALTLYRYSPKAYRYVESVFDNTLPKRNAVRRWRALEEKRELQEKSSSVLTTIDEVVSKENNCISDHNIVSQPDDNCISKNTDELSSENNCAPNNVNVSKNSNILKDTDKSKPEENNYIVVNGNELQSDENGIVIVDRELQPIPNCFICITNYDNS